MTKVSVMYWHSCCHISGNEAISSKFEIHRDVIESNRANVAGVTSRYDEAESNQTGRWHELVRQAIAAVTCAAGHLVFFVAFVEAR
jgi:hypothetical protein